MAVLSRQSRSVHLTVTVRSSGHHGSVTGASCRRPTLSGMTRTVDLVYFNAGGGHRAAAQALQAVLQQRHGPALQVRLVNLMAVLDAQDRFRRLTGMAPEDVYNRRLARGWTLGLAQELKLLQMLIRLGHRPMVRLLQQHWQAAQIGRAHV